jgi:hypothetical protein
MKEPRSVEAHLRILENIVEEMAWVQGKDRGKALEDLARRALEDIHIRLVAGQIPRDEKTRSRGREIIGHMKTCFDATGDAATIRKYQSLARNSLKAFVDCLEERGAISEPFEFR